MQEIIAYIIVAIAIIALGIKIRKGMKQKTDIVTVERTACFEDRFAAVSLFRAMSIIHILRSLNQ